MFKFDRNSVIDFYQEEVDCCMQLCRSITDIDLRSVCMQSAGSVTAFMEKLRDPTEFGEWEAFIGCENLLSKLAKNIRYAVHDQPINIDEMSTGLLEHTLAEGLCSECGRSPRLGEDHCRCREYLNDRGSTQGHSSERAGAVWDKDPSAPAPRFHC